MRLIGDTSSASRVLIAICSAHRMRDRRDAVRDTWLRALPRGIHAVFFVGAGAASDESDMVCLPVPDDYDSLSLKVYEFFRYALATFQFDYLFKCDDDTYVHAERLNALASGDIDFVGSRHFDSQGYASGGAGYLVSRALLEQLVREPVPARCDEDVVFSRRVPRDAARWRATDALQGVGVAFPDFVNDVVSGHWCSPAQMRTVHARVTGHQHEPVVLDLRAVHRVWAGAVRLFDDGVFWSRGPASPHGTWEPAGNGTLLRLAWDHWPTDVLHLTESGFAGPDLRLEFLQSFDRERWLARCSSDRHE